jgi:hypothetical protein
MLGIRSVQVRIIFGKEVIADKDRTLFYQLPIELVLSAGSAFRMEGADIVPML